jgi:hypothetical protein
LEMNLERVSRLRCLLFTDHVCSPTERREGFVVVVIGQVPESF